MNNKITELRVMHYVKFRQFLKKILTNDISKNNATSILETL